MTANFLDALWRLRDSRVMPFHEAKKIAAAFGNLVVELSDTKRHTLEDVERKAPYSLPLDRLLHSKQQIQTALAIVIAEFVVKLAVRPSEQARTIMNAAVMASGELQYFSRRHSCTAHPASHPTCSQRGKRDAKAVLKMLLVIRRGRMSSPPGHLLTRGCNIGKQSTGACRIY